MKRMTNRQRLLASVRREPFDALPWQFDLTGALGDRLRTYYHTDDLLSATGDHMVWVMPARYAGSPDLPLVGENLVRDDFGTVWHRDSRDRNVGDWGGVHSVPLEEPTFEGYTFPDGGAAGTWDRVPAIRRKYPDHFLTATGSGLFERGWALCGFENYLAYLAGEPAFIDELTDRLADYSCRQTALLKGTGVDGIRFGDDWGVQRSLMISPDSWRRIFKKYYKRIYGAAHDAGLVVMIHSCGNITDILPDLIDVGVEVVHPLQPEAMDVEFCQREYGKHLSFWGGLGSQSTIPLGTPEDNRKDARRMLDLFADGGYILAPAGAAPTETPVENIAAIVDEARRALQG
jgi:uroporphyrinogen decarboxylase